MPIVYNPQNFWEVCFTITGSKIPAVLKRVLLTSPCTVGAFCVVRYTEWLTDTDNINYLHILIPFSGVVGLLLAFRINDAFSKWNHAACAPPHTATRTANRIAWPVRVAHKSDIGGATLARQTSSPSCNRTHGWR